MNQELALTWTLGLLFFSGLVLAGSDGLWFPFPNLAGLALVGVVAALANVRFRQTTKEAGQMKPRVRQELVSVTISGIEDTRPDGVWARITSTGKCAWIPRRYSNFLPGRVLIPSWLAKRITRKESTPCQEK